MVLTVCFVLRTDRRASNPQPLSSASHAHLEHKSQLSESLSPPQRAWSLSPQGAYLQCNRNARSDSFRREITMTMFNATQRDKIARIAIRRGVGLFLSRLGRLINRWVAATIARHERQADLAALRQLSDRELQDIGLCRGDIGEGLAEAAKSRIRLQ
jgi:uncharacterized protein YjiS (DUF1127 family)